MKYLLLVVTLIALTGCFGKKEYVRDTKYIVETVPEELTYEEPLPETITSDIYRQLNLVEREAYLTQFSMRLVSVIESMNARFLEIANLEGRETEPYEDQ